jgi:drug/metabolite transporter (DMT)-like permease
MNTVGVAIGLVIVAIGVLIPFVLERHPDDFLLGAVFAIVGVVFIGTAIGFRQLLLAIGLLFVSAVCVGVTYWNLVGQHKTTRKAPETPHVNSPT